MKPLKAILLFVLPCLLLLSCKTKVPDIKLSRTDDAAILFGFLNPDADTITIALSLAEGVSDHKEKIISFEDLENAEVKLEHNGQSINLAFLKVLDDQVWGGDNRRFVFYALRSQFPILPGETYSVSARNKDIFALQSIVTVPAKAFDFDYEVTGPFNRPDGQAEYKVNVKVLDPGNMISFMRVLTQYKDQYSVYNMLDEVSQPKRESDGSIKFSFPYFGETPGRDQETTLNVSNISESYYRYMKSIENGDGENGNPFAEPTTMYTNIEGGYGVFAALCVKSKKIE